MFTDARAREAFPNWERVADQHAAALRAAADLGNRMAIALADELSVTAGAEFGRRFAAPAGLPAWTCVEHWVHPQAGELRLSYESLLLPDTREHRLIAYLPADADTADALAALVRTAQSRPPAPQPIS